MFERLGVVASSSESSLGRVSPKFPGAEQRKLFGCWVSGQGSDLVCGAHFDGTKLGSVDASVAASASSLLYISLSPTKNGSIGI